jgi:hypothetical protein
MTPPTDADEGQALVERYLSLCERRDAAAAQSCWSTDAKVVFPGPPGGRVFGSVDEMFASNNGRFRRAAKQLDFSVSGTRLSDGRSVAISTGTLHGETLAGTPFQGIRYLDLFVVEGGRIREQLVWNDLAECGL